MGIKILATGSYLPEKLLTNEMLSEIVDTNDEWIVSRTGISSRHIVDGESNLELTLNACCAAIDGAGIDRDEIGVLVCGTITNDVITPSLACLLQKELGLAEAMIAFDLGAACSGFIYSLHTAGCVLAGSDKRYALVTGSEVLTNITDFTDRTTCVLFGDGAGAAIIELDDSPYYFSVGTRGDADALYCPRSFDNNNPFSKNIDRTPKKQHVSMDGAAVYRFAVECASASILDTLNRAGIAPGDVKHYVLHQANARIVRAVAKKLGLPEQRFYMNVDRCGNTSGGSVAIALDEYVRSGAVQPGEWMVLSAFGGGLTYGAILMQY